VTKNLGAMVQGGQGRAGQGRVSVTVTVRCRYYRSWGAADGPHSANAKVQKIRLKRQRLTSDCTGRRGEGDGDGDRDGEG
jgi:hypothetical protein